MAKLEVNGVAIRGIAACVPSLIERNEELYPQKWGGWRTL